MAASGTESRQYRRLLGRTHLSKNKFVSFLLDPLFPGHKIYRRGIAAALQERVRRVEGSFDFAEDFVKKFFPFIPRYAVHLVILGITLLVVFNNVAAKRDSSRGEEKAGSSILFSGVLSRDEVSVVEGGGNLATTPHGIGGFSAQVLGTVLAANDFSGDTSTLEAEQKLMPLATSQGAALMPIPNAIIEQEVVAGPLEEERRETVEHKVTAGESISTIAAAYGVSTATVLSANNLTESAYIRPGDILKIPPVSGVLYTVKRGDTLSEIAKTYQGDLAKILEYNSLVDESSIQSGQLIIIPGGRIPPPPPRVAPQDYIAYSAEEEAPSSQISESGWYWPTGGRKINQYYSYRHHAVDIDGDTGNPIYSSREGTIVFAGWRTGYGKCIIISHPSGASTLYAHLSGYRKTGGTVEAGEVIGYMGSTGWSTGPHLHFELRTSRGSVNPLNYIR